VVLDPFIDSLNGLIDSFIVGIGAENPHQFVVAQRNL
jgi:hypothetical protein